MEKKILHILTTLITIIFNKIAKEKNQIDNWIDCGKKKKTYSDLIIREFQYSATFFLCSLIFAGILYYEYGLFLNKEEMFITGYLIVVTGVVITGATIRKNIISKKTTKNIKRRYLIRFAWGIQLILLLLALADIAYYHMLFVLMIGWTIIFLMDWETMCFYEHRYAKVIDKDNKIIKRIDVKGIRVKGSWISLPVVSKNNINKKEIKLIKKEDIKSITYYGSGIYIVRRMKFHNVEEEKIIESETGQK